MSSNNQLSAQNLKTALWETLQGVKNETVDPSRADAIASQAREILRTTNTQLRVSQQAKRPVPSNAINFSEA